MSSPLVSNLSLSLYQKIDGSGWDKTFSLNHIQDEGFEEIHFFGDKVSFNCFFRAWADEVRLTWVETITRSLRIRELLDIPLPVPRILLSSSTSYSSPRHRRVLLDSGSSNMHKCYLRSKRHPDLYAEPDCILYVLLAHDCNSSLPSSGVSCISTSPMAATVSSNSDSSPSTPNATATSSLPLLNSVSANSYPSFLSSTRSQTSP